MRFIKLAVAGSVLLLAGYTACRKGKTESYKVASDTSYEASLFRQHCSICHGPEGEGKTLDDGTIVPSLRAGPFKFRTEAEIAHQISEGGNGMTPFRTQLTEREIRLLTDFVRKKLRADAAK
ncbi:MAG: hypothetical protein C4325_14230 [Blastocatellia bacterium]